MHALILPLHAVRDLDQPLIGDKAMALARAARLGLRVPEALCVTTEAYRIFLQETQLEIAITRELARKRFQDMRWEELWDVSLRIRQHFAKANMPSILSKPLLQLIAETFADAPVVVRSSAPGEDSAETSFAGIHESFVNVVGAEAVLAHIKLVWSTLFSDKALLYRQELGLDPQKSEMAVIVQRLIRSERSGIAFSVAPSHPSQAVIEAVYGLNQGLVDGMIEPDRWMLDREGRAILKRAIAPHEKQLAAAAAGVVEEALAKEQWDLPVLGDGEVLRVFDVAMQAEGCFGKPQDVEWTLEGDELYTLQSRPITTITKQEEDPRRAYLALHRSFAQLQKLQQEIEARILPGMEEDAQRFAGEQLEELSDQALAEAIDARSRCFHRWGDAYGEYCIPFAHGMRLFGTYYADRVRPDDPHAFLDLIASSQLISIERNRRLEALAGMLEKGEGKPAFEEAAQRFLAEYGRQLFEADDEPIMREKLVELLRRLSSHDRHLPAAREAQREELEHAFFQVVPQQEQAFAHDLLSLARASYRLRDDDNISINKIEYELKRAIASARERLARQDRLGEGELSPDEAIQALRDVHYRPQMMATTPPSHPPAHFRGRQLLGQPAGKGVVRGAARVIASRTDMLQLKRGEIIVCDAIGPGITAVVSLAAGIVERRGGMLIHGAIIAREYGLPCVTGIPDATRFIATGDRITVDGDLGIVTIEKSEMSPP